MTQGDIEQVQKGAVEVLEPNEIIDVRSQSVSTTRPVDKVRTTEIVARGLDLLTSLGRLALRFLQESSTPVGVLSSSGSTSSEAVSGRGDIDLRGSSRQDGRRRRRHRGGA